MSAKAFQILKEKLKLPSEITIDDIDGTILTKVKLWEVVGAMDEYGDKCFSAARKRTLGTAMSLAKKDYETYEDFKNAI